MAKKQLTIEEKLQAALVPVEEQPYKVPENWCWVKLGTVITASKEKQDAFDSETKYVGLEHIEKDTGNISFALADEVKSTKSVFKCGDILYGKLRPYLNKHGIVDFNGVCSTDILVFNAIKGDNRLYDFYFSLPHFIEYAVSNSKGINLPRVSEKVILEIPFPMPPQGEQSRIVARIESLFAKLDEAKEKIQEVLDGADLRRAAILHQAFTGKLTEKWRKENSVDDESWKEKLFADFCETQYGYTESATNDPIGPKFLRITDIQDNQVEWNKVPYCKITNDDFEKYRLSYGDIVVARTGATTGKSFLIEDVTDAVFASYLIGIKIKEKSMVMPHFVYKFMQSAFYWQQITDFKIGIAQPGVNAKKLKTLRIKIPQIEEQQEIVRLLDNLLSREQSTVTACEEALTTIDTLKKSILARAFRGELGTNDPSEAGAQELLQEILAS